MISISYGDQKRTGTSPTETALLAITEQANAEGITLVSAAGDSGAADCDYSPDGTPLPLASLGLAIDLPAGLPTVTGLGGTAFNEGSSSALYWSTNNNPANGSALTYIPEATWNDTVAAGTLEAGGGGSSVYYSQPAWQTGIGVPNDNARDVPDISLNASPENDGYLTCSQGSCVNGYRDAGSNLDIVGGTSAGAPAFAGVVALINQKLSHPQGNVNPQLYQPCRHDTGSIP